MYIHLLESDTHISQTIIHYQTDLYTGLNITCTVYITVKSFFKSVMDTRLMAAVNTLIYIVLQIRETMAIKKLLV
jgi:hypothetical protein